MNNTQTLKMTDLDYMTASPHLQMIKAALPYVHIPEQKFFSMLVKVSELDRTLKLFEKKEDGAVGICSLEEDQPTSPLDMLTAMKPYGTSAEQEFIDLIINFLQASSLYQSYQESMETQEAPSNEEPASFRNEKAPDSSNWKNVPPSDIKANEEPQRKKEPRHFPIEQLKNFLPPEQQSRLETAQLLMQTFQQMP